PRGPRGVGTVSPLARRLRPLAPGGGRRQRGGGTGRGARRPGRDRRADRRGTRGVMESLKLGFFCWESLHAVRLGGLANAATHLAEALSRDHEVHFFTRGDLSDREIAGVAYHYCQP